MECKYLKLFLFFLLLLTCGVLYSQKLNSGFQQISVEEGLSTSETLCAFQDSRGFMWIGTHDGLNKFDGYKFTTYKKSERNPNSLNDNIIWSINETKGGTLWIGTNNGGLNKFDRETEKFTNYVYNPNNPNATYMHHRITSIAIDEDGMIWFTSRGLVKFNPVTEKFTAYLHDPVNKNSLIDNTVLAVHANSNDEILVGTYKGLSIYNHKTGDFHNFFLEQPIVGGNEVYSIYEPKNSSNEIYWLGTSDGLIKFDRKNGSFKVFRLDENHLEDQAFMMLNIIEDNNKNLWIGTEKGIVIFNTVTNSFYSSSYVKSMNKAIAENNIENSFVDKAGIIWLCVSRNGLIKYDSQMVKFKLYRNNPYNENSLPDRTIKCFYQEDGSALWVGTIQGGLIHLDRKNNIITTYKHDRTDPNGLSDNIIHVIFKDSRNYLWIGTEDFGLDRVKLTSDNLTNQIGDFEHFRADETNPKALNQNHIQTIFEDSKGRLWVATTIGLSRFVYETEEFENYLSDPNNPNSLINSGIQHAFAEDENGNLWIGTWGGLEKMDVNDLNNVKFTHYLNNSKDSTSLSENRVISNYIDKQGNIWLGTFGGGLNMLSFDEARKENPNDAKFIRYTEDDGLANNVIFAILPDKEGNLWISTNHGLSKFNIESETFTNYYEGNGLQSNEFFWGSSYMGKNGELFFGGTKGFNSFFPSEIKNSHYVPPVVITEFQVFNEPVKIGENSVLKKTITETKEIVLTHKEKVISFEFSSLHFSVPENNLYQYKLEGFDNKWLKIDARKRFATYTNLDAGEYLFRVKGTNSEGVWNDEETSIKLIVLPPWWATWWFRAIVIITILFLFIAFYYIRIRQIRARNILLKKLVKQRTKELDKKNYLLQVQAENLTEVNTLLEEKQQRIEEQAEEIRLQRDTLFDLNALKDKFFSIISHDLLSPFNALMGLSRLLETRFYKFDNNKKLEIIKAMNESITSILGLLTNLLDWSRSQREKIELRPQELDFNQLLKSNVKLLKSQTDAKQIIVKLNTESDELITKLDPNILNTVVRNLLNNAIKFTNEKGTIELGYKKNKDKLTAWVKDNGVGISPENAEKIFAKNQHFTTHGTKSEKGTGLGLIVCKEFIETHGGNIWLESEVGKGTTFLFDLPLTN